MGPYELVAQALPRRAVYHKIEFEPEAKPPTLADGPPFLVELRKEFPEVISARTIVASDGSPVFFQKKRDSILHGNSGAQPGNLTIKNKYPL